jgi:outer membrane protein OmpA-like peptidoglycan-associated protein/uncharacterized protein YidB (DUF937 family)
MFDFIIREVASRFGLGDKAGPLVQMLLSYITNKDTGGLAGFMSKLSSNGLGDISKSWLGAGTNAVPVSASQIETLMGEQGGLLNNVISKLGIGGSTAASALGYLLPLVIGKLTPGGTVPSSLSADVMGFITGGAAALSKGVTGAAGAVSGAAIGAAGAATVAASKVVGTAGHAVSSAANAGVNAASAASSGLLKWLPWLAAGIAALFLLSYCNKGSDAAKQAADGAKNAAEMAAASKTEQDAAAKAKADAEAAAKATADSAAKTAAETVPVGSGLVAYMHDGAPALKVYFDSGKTDVASGFADSAKTLIEHLKANASSKAVVSGYNDPTGNAAANAELSKNRAKGVATALKAAGIAEDRVVLEKPADTTGSNLSNSEARRVEVTVRK